MNACITANNAAEITLNAMPLVGFISSRLATRKFGCASSSRLVLLRRWCGPLPRRQRRNVSGNGSTIFGSEQRGIRDHFRHCASGKIAGWHHAIFKKAGDVFFGPVLIAAVEPDRRNVRRPFDAIRGPAGEPLTVDDSTKNVAGAMAFRAMPGPAHEVGAAVILR